MIHTVIFHSKQDVKYPPPLGHNIKFIWTNSSWKLPERYSLYAISPKKSSEIYRKSSTIQLSVFVHILWVSRTFQTETQVQTCNPARLQVWRSVFCSNGKGWTKAGIEIDTAGFQFPSNGKAHWKLSLLNRLRKICNNRFNSLQTGKHTERGLVQTDADALILRFNSLQTGKHTESISSAGYRHPTLRVSIPFKRESTLKVDIDWGIKKLLVCFNSLQTGKHTERETFPSANTERLKFQFPSNGKAHWKSPKRRNGSSRLSSVSIPFKRESTLKVSTKVVKRKVILTFQFPSNGKAHWKWTSRRLYIRRWTSFNSLQTGKHTESMAKHKSRKNRTAGFNSLQTGKHTERPHALCRQQSRFAVSIPFKRESTLKAGRGRTGASQSRRGFQFPSNGKAHWKKIVEDNEPALVLEVSIPFKRESTLKVWIIFLECLDKFFVSIPFKRESTLKA